MQLGILILITCMQLALQSGKKIALRGIILSDLLKGTMLALFPISHFPSVRGLGYKMGFVFHVQSQIAVEDLKRMRGM